MTLISKVIGAVMVSGLAMGAPMAANAATTVIPFSSTPATSGNFMDSFSFDFPTSGKVSISINSSFTGPLTNVNFLNKGVTFNGTPLSAITSGANELLELLNQPVAAGLQTLSVYGSAQKMGSYSGTLTFADVPEPGTWAMMILGLGAVGFAMRRRPAKTAYAAQ
ncbi:MAG: FxDxF family PEP-CTERM protein [Sphingobium sp.]